MDEKSGRQQRHVSDNRSAGHKASREERHPTQWEVEVEQSQEAFKEIVCKLGPEEEIEVNQ